MLNRTLCTCLLSLALLVGLSPIAAYAAGNTWANYTPTKTLDITMPQSLHDFPIATDATFNPFLKVADGVHIMFSYDSNWSMDDLFNMYSLYMKNSEEFIADKGDGTGTLYGVSGIKQGYKIQITIGLSIDNQVTVAIEPNQD